MGLHFTFINIQTNHFRPLSADSKTKTRLRPAKQRPSEVGYTHQPRGRSSSNPTATQHPCEVRKYSPAVGPLQLRSASIASKLRSTQTRLVVFVCLPACLFV